MGKKKSKRQLVLMYHNIVNSDEGLHLYDVPLSMFRKQMEIVAKQNEISTDLEVIITFDDGYRSWGSEVLEILKEFKLRAYFFVCVQFLKEGMITELNILKLKKYGMIIGSHAMQHRFLSELKKAEIMDELKKSREFLEKLLSEKVKYFSVPRGVHNSEIIRISKVVGYEKVFCSKIGINNPKDFLIKRIAITRNTTLGKFSNIISCKNIKQMILLQCFLDGLKNILGIKLYNRLRSLVVKLTG